MSYELLEHTADIRIRVKGKDAQDVFMQAGLALFDILAERGPGAPHDEKKISLSVSGGSLDELFVNWLNELLSLAYAKEIIFTNFEFSQFCESSLEAHAIALPMQQYRINTEIKAATYH